jgi:ABC-type transporter Mla subunit MlaD
MATPGGCALAAFAQATAARRLARSLVGGGRTKGDREIVNERTLQFRVGVMVLATALIAGILIIVFNQTPLWTRTYTVRILLPEARGVTEGTPVRKRGILIGRVTGVELAQDGVLVTARIEARYSIDPRETVLLRNTLLGDAELDVIPADRTDGASADHPADSPARQPATI